MCFHRYYVCVAILIYFLPLLVMGCAYLVVGLTLWASEIPGDSSDRYKEQLNAKRKVTRGQMIPPESCQGSTTHRLTMIAMWRVFVWSRW